ncbi:MAG: hypothetical protein RLZZ563_121, partial [Pseudomonadota bacterium]
MADRPTYSPVTDADLAPLLAAGWVLTPPAQALTRTFTFR